jgi:hypothetical protein
MNEIQRELWLEYADGELIEGGMSEEEYAYVWDVINTAPPEETHEPFPEPDPDLPF